MLKDFVSQGKTKQQIFLSFFIFIFCNPYGSETFEKCSILN